MGSGVNPKDPRSWDRVKGRRFGVGDDDGEDTSVSVSVGNPLPSAEL